MDRAEECILTSLQLADKPSTRNDQALTDIMLFILKYVDDCILNGNPHDQTETFLEDHDETETHDMDSATN